jgi:hypothetical protein
VSVVPKIPNEAPPCQREGASSSPLQVMAMPVGPTGGESPQARASRGAASAASAAVSAGAATKRSGRITARP